VEAPLAPPAFQYHHSPMEQQPDELAPSFTRELFCEWRSPRMGDSNPQRMNNPVWDWLIRSRLNAYQASERMDGPNAMDAGPGWCFERFGQSSTELSDGRVILIGGEHEDFYDPDFYIYNDVVIQHADGAIDIFGYPRDVFPPTDSHSATLVGNHIIIIGNLGYREERHPGSTPVFALDLDTWTISSVLTHGTPPGWIHKHEARLSDDGASILIHHGTLDRGDPDRSLVENIDDWRLNLADWRWERITQRQWPRWEFLRKDEEPNHLFQIQQALWVQQYPQFGADAGLMESFGLPSLEEELGGKPDLDLFQQLYHPPVPQEELPSSPDEPNIHRVKVAGVIVRYVDDMRSIQMTVEGELPPSTLDALTTDLLAKLSTLENAPFEMKRL
jgi:hypothetical protein